MPGDRRRRVRAGVEAARAVLWREWDPLDLAGIAPADEYDTYAGHAYAMAQAGAGAAAIAEYLIAIEQRMMNIDETPATRDRALRVAGILVTTLRSPDPPAAAG